MVYVRFYLIHKVAIVTSFVTASEEKEKQKVKWSLVSNR